MLSGGLLKGVGLAASLFGAGAALVSDWVDDKKMDEKIEAKVNEALAKQDEENNKEEES